jgi:hypothetical protein
MPNQPNNNSENKVMRFKMVQNPNNPKRFSVPSNATLKVYNKPKPPPPST